MKASSSSGFAEAKRNVEGNLFVDRKCIGCQACRWMCPSVFGGKTQAVVVHQPETEQEKLQAYAAMVSCPMNAIHTRTPDPLEKQAEELFPAAIDSESIPGVHHLGYHSDKSLGGTAYLIAHPEGNVMIDVPRFDAKLADRIEQRGGLHSVIITHRDMLADHALWHERFPDAQRIIHAVDTPREAQDIEAKLDGTGSWHPLSNLTIIHTPGHTAGSLCVLYHTPRDAVLFSGHHLSYNADWEVLEGFRAFCKGNPEVQLDWMINLASDDYPFLWVLPAHGRMARFADLQEKRNEVLRGAMGYVSSSPLKGSLRIFR